jgi:hypothetical protein
MDAPILSDYHRYLLSRTDNPPAYVEQATPQVVDHPSGSIAEVPPDPKRWSAWDKALQGTFAGMSLYDALDTNHFLKTHPNGQEENPLLGKRPSAGKLLGATALGQVAHGLVTNQLSQPWRRLWQLGTMGLEGSVIANNARRHDMTPIFQLGDKF